MALFADTHILAWLTTGDRRLSAVMKSTVFDRIEPVLVSGVTAWEYADLWGRGRLAGSAPLDDVLSAFDLDIVALPRLVWRLATTLPGLHRDPVDRMLVAHAIVDGYGLITADTTVRRYPVRCIG